ncbi:MAG: type I-E CRISPR-associated protein Cas6/Cse3/CasE [Tomitella sp.]|nr:type I-E CRISPR-associated protein Cas6/Cse3/CasE [Tomitella sp.]
MTTATLYRSLLSLDAEHPAIRAAIVDAHHMHALVMSGFADRLQDYDFFTGQHTGHGDHRAALGIQHAVSFRPDGTIRVLVQAAAQPHWHNSDCGKWVDALTSTPHTSEYTPILDGTVRYELRANPVRRDRKRKIALRHHNDLTTWWQRKAVAAGLHLTSPASIDAPWQMQSATKTSRTNPTRSGTGFTIDTHRFTGFATITDPDAHQAALAAGIGPARAYGCGMMLTMRPRH